MSEGYTKSTGGIMLAPGEKEICNECGRSVAFNLGLFVNRVPDLNSIEERKDMGKPYPDGAFMCRECDSDDE